MDELFDSVARLLSDIVLPSLKSVQAGQTEQIEATLRVERALQSLKEHFTAEFAELHAKLTACRAELAATQAMLRAAGVKIDPVEKRHPELLH